MELDHRSSAARARERCSVRNAGLEAGGRRPGLGYWRRVGTRGRVARALRDVPDTVLPVQAAIRPHGELSMSDRIAVVGAGQMGNGIAHVFAQSGYQVTMIDVSEVALQRGHSAIARNMDRQVKKGILSQADRDAALARVATATSLDAASNATLVVEAAAANTELKFRNFA